MVKEGKEISSLIIFSSQTEFRVLSSEKGDLKLLIELFDFEQPNLLMGSLKIKSLVERIAKIPVFGIWYKVLKKRNEIK